MGKYRIRVFPHKEKLIYMPQVQYRGFFGFLKWKDYFDLSGFDSSKIDDTFVELYKNSIGSEYGARGFIEYLQKEEQEKMAIPIRSAKFAEEHPEQIIELD